MPSLNKKTPAQYVELDVVTPSARTHQSPPSDGLIDFVSRLMDSLFRVPGTKIRFGLNPVIDLVPGVGDQVGALISSALLFRSLQYRLPRIVIARMALNILINSAVGVIPVFGSIFTMFFRSNLRNYELLRKFAGTGREATRADWLYVSGLVGFVFFALVAVFFLLAYAFLSEFRWW